MLKEKNYMFDIAFTSVLKRAIKTLFMIQDEMDLHWLPVTRHWRLNERHYGGLQGLNKSETAAKHGEDQVKVNLWQELLTFACWCFVLFFKKSVQMTSKSIQSQSLNHQLPICLRQVILYWSICLGCQIQILKGKITWSSRLFLESPSVYFVYLMD